MKENRALNVVIDTNLWISFLISHRYDRIDNLLLIERIKFLFSEELLTEISATITKPKISKYFGADALDEMLSKLDTFMEFIEVHSKVNKCRDEKDNFLLALAKDGNADYLITGDSDLLDLKKFGRTHIVTIVEFLDRMSK